MKVTDASSPQIAAMRGGMSRVFQTPGRRGYSASACDPSEAVASDTTVSRTKA